MDLYRAHNAPLPLSLTESIMETRKFGNTDLEVTRLAFGGARIGFEDVTDDQVDALLNGLLDNGVTFLDTAACYDDSEELIGKFVSHRREEYVLASKCGHVAGDATGEPWTADTINHSIDRSLRLLKTDRIDLMQLHSCSAEVLKKGEAVEAVQRAQEAGKVRYLSYSGDGDNALHAIGMGIFATLQTSFNVVDQKARLAVLPAAVEAGMGIVAKRPIANGALGKAASPYSYADAYWDRSRAMTVPDGAPKDGIELALRFTLSHDAIDTAIVGTTKLANAQANIASLANGPLDGEVITSLHEQFDRLGADWNPQT
jgi:aryl-alcohol dehydrogenase-like predicted oxidoreductase